MTIKKNKIFYIILIFILSFAHTLKGQSGFFKELRFNGQLSSMLSPDPANSFQTFAGIRYIPEIHAEKRLSDKTSLDTEISFNGFGNAFMHSFNNTTYTGKVKPYRMWLRFSSRRFEIRAGLQKINFGSANLLRPLMWFDKIDPHDPLQLTDGVYALLAKYYFQNNTNIWLWSLYGNDNTKGWEVFPSVNNRIEFGGRFQSPVLNGELAFTYHNRKADLSKTENYQEFSTQNFINENRIGIDGKWDVGIGLWFELSLTHQDFDISQMNYRRALNLGIDYTFGIGNGINVMTEFFTYGNSDQLLSESASLNFSAFSFNYPISLIDNISLMIYYDQTNKEWYRFANWSRTYDKWSFYLMGFWNPDKIQIYNNQEDFTFFTGNGIMFMVVFNH